MTVVETNLDDPRFEGIGGIIGQDLLSRFGSVKIDYRARTVEFAPKEGKVSKVLLTDDAFTASATPKLNYGDSTLTQTTDLTGTANSSDLEPFIRRFSLRGTLWHFPRVCAVGLSRYSCWASPPHRVCFDDGWMMVIRGDKKFNVLQDLRMEAQIRVMWRYKTRCCMNLAREIRLSLM
jgi:hypothetical protein